MEIFKTTPKIPFLKFKFWALGLTAAIVLAGILNIAFGNGLKLGVDFGEGTLIRVIFKAPVSVDDIRNRLKEVGLEKSSIQETGKGGREFQIRSIEIQAVETDDSLESHARLGDEVIKALLETDGQSETAQGLRDLNSVDQRTLAGLLEPGFPEQGEDLAARILAARKNETNQGIFVDYDDLQRDGLPADVVSFLKGKTYLGKLTVLSRESVGPQVGKDLRKKALLATIWSLIGMLVYVAFRFKLAFGVAAIFTLTQDVLVTVSIYSFSGREVSLPVIAALLTIVGFSINDTIIIFDRIRENQKSMRKMPLEGVMNTSLNQMLGRTFITSGTLFMTVLALFLFGGPVINDFAFVMLIGTIEGVYSTISLSCPVVLFWQKWFPAKRRRK